ncbi:MAG: hypothetical protein OEY01_14690 [Desulfobulbaceae bacterium]|nr:hypothetical protein [Desulfobulbaceae bacterium]
MITEKGTLIVGVEYKGKTHRDFELRPILVEDSFTISDSEHAKRAATDNSFNGIVTYALRLVKLGDIPPKEITPNMIMNMVAIDLDEIMEADGRLKTTIDSFRKQFKATPQSGAGSDENGVQRGASAEDARSGSSELAGSISGDQEPAAGEGEEVQGEAATEEISP